MEMIKKHYIKPNQKKHKEHIIRHYNPPKLISNIDFVNQKIKGEIIATLTLILVITISATNPISIAVSLIVASILLTPYLYKNLTRR
jgi:hypothetical protein